MLQPSHRLSRYVYSHWETAIQKGLPKSFATMEPKKLSAGFLGVSLALHLCSSVTLYGYGHDDSHYYLKKWKNDLSPFAQKSERKFEDRHAWDVERACVRILRKNDLVSLPDRLDKPRDVQLAEDNTIGNKIAAGVSKIRS